MSAVATTLGATPRGSSSRAPGVRRRRILITALVGVCTVGAVVGIRVGAHPRHVEHGVVLVRPVAVPLSTTIEQAWGIRFTAVLMLADNGAVELRYQVIDPSKAGHIGDPANNDPAQITPNYDPTANRDKNMPSIVVESNGRRVLPNSAMFHMDHTQSQVDGRTYSIIYGNAGGAIMPGHKVTILMADGLRLEHVVVGN